MVRPSAHPLGAEESLKGDTHPQSSSAQGKSILEPGAVAGPRCVSPVVPPSPWGPCVGIHVFCLWCVKGNAFLTHTYLMLLCDCVYQKIGSDVVNVWNQDGGVLGDAIRWVEVRLQPLVPVFPVTCVAGRGTPYSERVL